MIYPNRRREKAESDGGYTDKSTSEGKLEEKKKEKQILIFE